MSDVQRLLDNSFPFVEELLKNYGEFYPLASAIRADDSIAQIGTFDGNDNPLSEQVIAVLKKGLRAKKENYKSIIIYYDVRVINPFSGQKTDAVAAYFESKYDKTAYVFYYPYVLTKGRCIEFFKSWKEEAGKEIFDI